MDCLLLDSLNLLFEGSERQSGILCQISAAHQAGTNVLKLYQIWKLQSNTLFQVFIYLGFAGLRRPLVLRLCLSATAVKRNLLGTRRLQIRDTARCEEPPSRRLSLGKSTSLRYNSPAMHLPFSVLSRKELTTASARAALNSSFTCSSAALAASTNELETSSARDNAVQDADLRRISGGAETVDPRLSLRSWSPAQLGPISPRRSPDCYNQKDYPASASLTTGDQNRNTKASRSSLGFTVSRVSNRRCDQDTTRPGTYYIYNGMNFVISL